MRYFTDIVGCHGRLTNNLFQLVSTFTVGILIFQVRFIYLRLLNKFLTTTI